MGNLDPMEVGVIKSDFFVCPIYIYIFLISEFWNKAYNSRGCTVHGLLTLLPLYVEQLSRGRFIYYEPENPSFKTL